MEIVFNLALVSVGALLEASQIRAVYAGHVMNLVKHAVEPVKTLALLARLLTSTSSISLCAFKRVQMDISKVSKNIILSTAENSTRPLKLLLS